MSNDADREQFPSGYGVVTGVWLGLAVGIIAFLVSAQIPIGLVTFVAAGAAIGIGLERFLETRPPTASERRVAVFLGIAGVVVGGMIFFVVFD